MHPLGLDSTNSGNGVVRGSTVPRLWTPPLRDLSDPDSTYGYELIEFAGDAGAPFDDWQQWLAIHAGELLPDGRPRFRIVLVLVSRQNGKTHFGKILSAWWLHVDLPGSRPGSDDPPTVLGISSKLEYAAESWAATVRLCQNSPLLAPEIPKNGVREANGQQCLTTTHGTRYKIAAGTDDAGRSLTVDRLLVDELRRQQTWTAWSAAEPTTTSIADAQIVCMSNQGDSRSVVLDSLRKSALHFIETGVGDSRLGIFEWSAPDGSDPTDAQALAMANPNLNHPSGRNPLDALMGNAIRAKAAGGQELAKFKTESMCMRVHVLDPAINHDRWFACGDEEAPPLDTWRDRVALCVDVSLDLRHATLVGAAEVDDLVHLETIKVWHGEGCTAALLRELPAIVRRVRPRAFGYLPSGPAASVAAKLADPKKRRSRSVWPPAGVTIQEIRTDLVQVTMGFSELVTAEQVVHPNDDLLNKHIQSAQKLWRGDGWVYARKDAGPIDGAYACAGAAHMARTLPPSPGRPRIVTAK